MDAFLGLPGDERRTYCEQAQARLGLPPASIEKDLWVCWTLRELFALPEWGAHLTFKGGTSLSKGFGLIKRFSEDIDIVIDRVCLGFGGADDPVFAPSAKQRKKRVEALKQTCRDRIQQDLYPAMEGRFAAHLPDSLVWSIEIDPNDPDGQTILFHYPGEFGGRGAYVRPVVRIEMGARSDAWPSETVNIQPYLREAFPDLFNDPVFTVKALSPERTFWEKAMLLHEETFRPAKGTTRARLARHYYDLWCLIEHGIAGRAAHDRGLFANVAKHRKTYFRHNWVDYDTLKPGALRLVPSAERLQEWRNDYENMSDMLFGETPSFETVMEVVRQFEQQFNAGGVAPAPDGGAC